MDIATENVKKLDELIKQSNSILIVCHSGADPDALASLVALKEILVAHYQKQNVVAMGEKIPKSLSFIPGYGQITNGSILKALQENSFDLMICLDFSQLHLSSKDTPQEIADTVAKQGIPLVVIDHHPEAQHNLNTEIYLNLDPTSTCSNLHLIFHKILNVPITENVASHLLIGIIADTNRFKFKYGAESQSTVLEIAAELLKYSSLSIEDISLLLERLDLKMLKVAMCLIDNIKVESTLAYTTITKEQMAEHGLDTTKLGDAATYIANQFISAVDTAKRGFVLYPYLIEDNVYSVRFRSCDPKFPVNEWAKALGGGGHPQSAAARVQAEDTEEALEKVLEIVNAT